MMATHAANIGLFQEKERLLMDVVRAMVCSVEAKDEYTRGHSERVALFSKRLAQAIGFTDEECQRIYLTGLLHDVGKIGVSDATLNKPGRLTDEEFREIQQHPNCGWVILHDLEPLHYVLPGVLHHHERYDGAGYPDGLAGEDIPIDGRILAIGDAYDAMTSDRPYREGMPQERAEAILREGAGAQWDPRLVDVFFQIMPDIITIRANYQGTAAPVRKVACGSPS
jgi:HD-GYP domain-containing protein (c-di-GMP phosphodiesterase class II)